jgi:hypothetical protein
MIRRDCLNRMNILCIADADRRKQGGSIFGIPIVAPETLAEGGKSATVIVTPTLEGGG